jgi:hypothetical protein
MGRACPASSSCTRRATKSQVAARRSARSRPKGASAASAMGRSGAGRTASGDQQVVAGERRLEVRSDRPTRQPVWMLRLMRSPRVGWRRVAVANAQGAVRTSKSRSHGRARVAAAAVITPTGIAIPAAVLATQAVWSGVAFASSATRYDATLTSPCTKQYANTWEHATAAKLYGASTKFKPPTWHVWKASSHFLNQELWVYTDWSKTSNPISHDTHKTWVEAGLHDGIFSSSHGLSFQYLGGFWADSRGGTGGYHNHSLTQIWAPHASSTYQFSILRHSATYSNYNVSARIYSKNLTVTHSQKGESTHDPHTESGQWTNPDPSREVVTGGSND